MSASDKKKLRKEQATALLTERQRQEQAEAKKLKLYTIGFISILVIVACVAIGVLVYRGVTQSGIAEKTTIAAVVDGVELNSVEMNYYYNDAINEFRTDLTSQYEGYEDFYLSTIKLDPNAPMTEQINPETNKPWSDYFMELALENAKHDFALVKLATAANFTLPEEDRTTLDTMISNLELYAQIYGYANADKFLQATYGFGSTVKNYTAYVERGALADAYLEHYYNELSFTDEDYRDYEKDNVDAYNTYSYDAVYLSYTDFIPKDTTEATNDATAEDTAEGATEATTEDTAEDTTEATTEDTAEDTTEGTTEDTAEDTTEGTTEDTAEDTAEDTTEGTAADDTEAKNNAGREAMTAVAEQLATCTNLEELVKMVETIEVTGSSKLNVESYEDKLHTSINSDLAKWLADPARKDGELGSVKKVSTDSEGNETIDGYYIAIFHSKSDSKTPMANVRHLLVQFTSENADETTTETEFTEEEKAAAKKTAEEYLKTWQEGKADEASFIELVKEHSDDAASVPDGGLYENLYPGASYEAGFLEWAIDPTREKGDTGIVETSYGYHIMYYVGDTEMTYRDYMIDTELREETYNQWYEDLLASVASEIKNTSRVHQDLIMGSFS